MNISQILEPIPQSIRRSASRLDPDYFFAKRLPPKLSAAMDCVQAGSHRSILDVGCGNKPYQYLFDASFSYWGADVVSSKYSDIISDAESLPFGANSFDII